LHAPELADTRYLDIGATLTMDLKNMNAERVAFWRKLAEERCPRRGKL
jgi:hypothetical protein